MVAEGIVLGCSLRAAPLLALGRTFADRLNGQSGLGFAYCDPRVGQMGTSVILRWRVSGVECELEMEGAIGQVCIRQDGKIVQSGTVESAVAAHEWASKQIQRLEGEQRRAG